MVDRKDAASPGDATLHRAILEHAADLVMIVDEDGQITYSSPAVARLLGYEPGERIGRSFFELVHPDDLEEQRRLYSEALEETGRVVTTQVRVRHKDGNWRNIRGIGKNLTDHPDIRGVLINARDVTDLVRARTELAQVRLLLEEVVNAAPIVLWRVDAEGEFQLSEGRGLERMGLEPGQVVGQNVFELYADNEEVLSIMRRALAGEVVSVQAPADGRVFDIRVNPIREGADVVGAVGVAVDITEMAEDMERAQFQARLLNNVGQSVIATRPDGTVIYWNETAQEMYGWSREEAMGRYVQDLTVPALEQETAAEIMEALALDERWTGEFTVQRKDGSQFPALVTNVPVREDGELVAIIGVSSDLTERKRLEDQVRHSQKLEAVGQLAGGIAHEFNNLLTAIGGYASLAAERAQAPQVAADLDQIVEATDRARGLAGKLLAFSRRRRTRMQPVDLNATLRDMTAMLNGLVGDEIVLEMELADELWPCTADPSLMEQVIVNLVLNARDAMPHGGRVVLATARVTVEARSEVARDADLEAGEYVRLTVTDDGTGIEPEDVARVFDPFFSTRDVGQGSGLGLSMVYGAVSQAGGGVLVESEPGEGSRFVVFLPKAQSTEEATEAPRAAPSATKPDAQQTVLVVEDEEAVLSLTRRVLERAGYEVMEARSGVEAFQMVAVDGATVDLLVTDVIMPQMGGPELLRKLRASDVEVPSVFMSGYTADELETHGLDSDVEFFLPKPFTPAELTDIVQRALED